MFVAVVGPSGAGKDTLLSQAAPALAHRRDVIFARRVITRTSHDASEDHDTMSAQAFAAAKAAGKFCLTWHAHGLDYGIPASARDLVARGNTVVANVSRTVVSAAADAFTSLAIIEIDADPAVLAERIAARGRETKQEAVQRAARLVQYTPPAGCPVHHVDNSRLLADSKQKFISVLTSLSQLHPDAIRGGER